MRKILSLSFILIYVLSYAQQEAQFSQNMYNQMAINPGVAGSTKSICATAFARQQWVGFKDIDGNKGAPQTYLLTVHGPVKAIKGGLGLGIMSDKLGFENNLGVKLSYAYRLENVWKGNLGVGLNVGFLNKSVDFGKFKPIQDDDPLLKEKSVQKDMLTDLGLGIYYSIPDKIYFGASTSQMLQSKGNFGVADITLRRHYYITAGYSYKLPDNPSILLEPSFFIKSDGASTQFDFNALVEYNKKFWGGLSYRVTDAIVVLLGVNYKDFRFGYSYDFTTSDLGKKGRSSGSHEIMLGYCFKLSQESVESNRNIRVL